MSDGIVKRRRFNGVRVQFERADPSVGIMSESFSAWPTYSDDEDRGPWCCLIDFIAGTFEWKDSETGKTCPRPGHDGILTERTCLAFAREFYEDLPSSDDEQVSERLT